MAAPLGTARTLSRSQCIVRQNYATDDHNSEQQTSRGSDECSHRTSFRYSGKCAGSTNSCVEPTDLCQLPKLRRE